MYINENLNPSGKKVGDCVIRAIAKAENKPWLETYDILSKMAREQFNTPNGKEIYTEYLKDYPTVKVMRLVKGKNKRYTVNQIAKDLPKGSYVVSLAGHMVAVVDNNYYDIWDCGESCSYKIWKVK